MDAKPPSQNQQTKFRAYASNKLSMVKVAQQVANTQSNNQSEE